MKKYFTTGIGRLRLTGFLEGLSFLILLGIAVPTKYVYNNPLPVKIIGQIHGILFIAYILLAGLAAFDRKWSFGKITWKILIASVIPFGTFYTDHKILKPMQDEN